MAQQVQVSPIFQGAAIDGFITPGPAFIRAFPFTFATPGLTTGVTLYTPAVGDVIYDVLVSVPTAFNGTTPLADVGTFNGGNTGLYGEVSQAVDLTAANAAVTDNAGLATTATSTSLLGGASLRIVVTAANPLLLVVSQTGAKGGTATGATAGSGVVYVVTCSPG